VRHRASGGAWQDGLALDIGAGGTFLVDASWPVGSSVELAIDIAAREGEGALILPGVVRWTSGDGSDDDDEAKPVVCGLAGVGVQFVGLDLDIIKELHAHLASLAPADAEAEADGAAKADGGPEPVAIDGDGDAVLDDDDADVPATD
jgi:hypothetical protein